MPAALASINLSTRLFRAMADPTRLRLLHLLVEGERCVCDLVNVIDCPQPKISRHLAYLKRAGLVLARREGLWIHYRLAPPASPLHRKLLDCVKGCFSDVPLLQRDAKKLAQRCCP